MHSSSRVPPLRLGLPWSWCQRDKQRGRAQEDNVPYESLFKCKSVTCKGTETENGTSLINPSNPSRPGTVCPKKAPIP